jgi:hypothetical protein
MTDYTKLITSEHRDKPKFLATVQLFSDVFNAQQQTLVQVQNSYDVDVAVGQQLDTVGLWVGVSRIQQVPIAGVYLTWDDPALGWDFAVWKGPFEPSQGVTSLDDDSYRAVIKGRIASNYFKGTVQSSNDLATFAFEIFGIYCFIIDHQNMSIDIYIAGGASAVLIEMIKRGTILPKTAGVRINSVTVAPGPFFALDAPTTPFLAGLDVGVFNF